MFEIKTNCEVTAINVYRVVVYRKLSTVSKFKRFYVQEKITEVFRNYCEKLTGKLDDDCPKVLEMLEDMCLSVPNAYRIEMSDSSGYTITYIETDMLPKGE
jgi:hypothetical protein